MSRTKQFLLDIIDRLKSIPAIDSDSFSSLMFKHVANWNNQIYRMQNSKGYSVLSPAAFVEIKRDNVEFLGYGYSSYDAEITIHIYQTELDAADGTLDQNLNVFDLREEVKNYLNLFSPDNSSPFMYKGEEEHFGHDNIYHYKLQFHSHFVDDAGSIQIYEFPGRTYSLGLSMSLQPPMPISLTDPLFYNYAELSYVEIGYWN